LPICGFTRVLRTILRVSFYYYGKEAGYTYVRGLRNIIDNDKPIIGKYDVNNEGSGDMYPKGANMFAHHT
jgi:hypothetical protein